MHGTSSLWIRSSDFSDYDFSVFVQVILPMAR
jgi:hypothetical protein